MSDTIPTPADVARPRTYTQVELTHAIKESLDAQRADYEAAREAAQHADVSTQRIADLEREVAEARRETLVTTLISSHGLSTEDAQLLTGHDEATLTAQAERLQSLANVPRTNGLIARKEGQPVRRTDRDDNKRSFLTELGVSDDL